MKINELKKLTGGLTKTTKMPCQSYSLSTKTCKVGNKLSNIKGSVCEKCYAKKGNYVFPAVKNAQKTRDNFTKSSKFVSVMTEFITKTEKSGYFRWHDSGDIYSKEYLDKICSVAANTPNIKHYLPTKEIDLVLSYKKTHKIPDNLTIRISSPMIDTIAITNEYPNNVVVTKPGINEESHTCEATLKTGTHTCGKCRACWDKNIKTIEYIKH